jgi:ubiquinone/menaquinone biosynthesis C-methylase UbiE
MRFDAQSHWNKSHISHPKDRMPSNYSIEKEKSFPKNSLICDIGGGDGADSIYFISKGHKVYLYDISDAALNTARGKAAKNGVENQLITSQLDLSKGYISSESNLFDVIYARLSLHYFTQEIMIAIFKEIYRIMKTGGISYLAVKSPEDREEMAYLKSKSEEVSPGEFVDDNGMVKTRYTKDQYKEMLKSAGISNFEVKDFVENFGEQKTYVKSGAEKLLYIEIIIKK